MNLLLERRTDYAQSKQRKAFIGRSKRTIWKSKSRFNA